LKSKTDQTTIIIVGSMHLAPDEYPEYRQWLTKIIEEIAPNIICAELSPEQLAGTQTCNSKPEQRDIVMPTARRLGIPIVPIQLPTPIAIEWDNQYKALENEVRMNETSCAVLDFCNMLAHKEADLWRIRMKSASCIEHYQYEDYHVFCEARDEANAILFPELAKPYNEWNEYFLEQIEHTIKDNPGSRIMVIAGLWHKYWLWNRLEGGSDVAIYNVISYREKYGKQQ